jgi:eukaryotic-like serine/threonine-protein kinase
MHDLTEQLAAALGSSYRIDTELGGGGMSRVFRAEDVALGRSVVIKLLHPELAAGVNAERFNREVQLAARLQHPHIVPVITAGQVDGLPYYVMPFVKGESLQARLARGQMPFSEIVSIMGDVLKALAYAHADGVVHRDIKPDNILLSGGAAVVADFGIAKAISSARRDEGGLTSVGTSLGTAGYMAPEQVAGDPSLDHRADIYALGCVAYEMLTGAAPFAGKSPQQMLAAHVLETPVPIRERRPDTPPALAALVERCMAKDPADRPQTASEVLEGLDQISLGTGPHTSMAPKKRSGVAIGVAAVVVVAAIAGFVFMRGRAKPTSEGVLIAVAPFEVLDPQLGLWKEGLVDVLSRNLDGAASMHTVSPSAAVKRWEGRVGREDAMTFAKRTGAQIVIYGSLQPAGRDIVDAKVWVLDTRSGSAPAELQARDSSSRIDRLSDTLSVKLLSALGDARGGGAVHALGSGSLPAIKAFLQGAQYFRKTRFDSAAAMFREAITIDTNFAIAYSYLNQALGWTGGAGDERLGLALAGQRHLGPGLSSLDSLLIVAIAHYYDTRGNIVANQRAGYQAMELATQRYPNDAFAAYLLADFRFHADPNLSDQEALLSFDRAIQKDSDFAPTYIHPIEISFRYGHDAAARYVRAYLARDPKDREGRGLALALDLSAPGGTTDPKLRALIDTGAANVIQAASSALARLPDSAETSLYMLKTAALRRDAKTAGPGFESLIVTQLGMHGHVAEAWRRTVAAKNFTAAEFVVLGLVSADSAKALIALWLQMRSDASTAYAPVMAFAKDTAALLAAHAGLSKAAAALKPDVPMRQREGMKYFVTAMHAYYQLAKGDSTAAAREFETVPDSLFQLPVDQFIRGRLMERTDPKRALQFLTAKRASSDIIGVARELEVGRLAEKLNDVPRAVDAYAYVAGAWQNSESDQLQNAVRESRAALKRLDSDGRVRGQLVNPR